MHAAVDADDLAVDMGAVGRGQHGDNAGDVFGHAELLVLRHQMHQQHAVDALAAALPEGWRTRRLVGVGWPTPVMGATLTDPEAGDRLALTEEGAQQIPEVKEMIDNPPDWLKNWSKQIGAELA